MSKSGFQAALFCVVFWCADLVVAQDCPSPLVLVSVTADGQQGNHNSIRSSSPSSGGVYVAFETVADDLLPGDDNDEKDVVLKNMVTGELLLVSVTFDGGFPDKWSSSAKIGCDGTLVGFKTASTDIIENDTNDRPDVFVRDIIAGATTVASVSSTGEQGNGTSDAQNFSGDGRYVAFASWASNLVPDDNNNKRDAFVHDLWTGETTLVSVSTEGAQGNSNSFNPALSFDGRYVVFESGATTLVADDNNNTVDIFVHDRETGQTVLVSASAAGVQGNGWSSRPDISADGSVVSFESQATNLIPDDDNFKEDVFVVEWQKTPRVVERVSVSSGGEGGNFNSDHGRISGDGMRVVFNSFSTNLVPEGASGGGDVYVHDRLTGTTQKVSTTFYGEQQDMWSAGARISCDGLFVSFGSLSTNLVPGDSNDHDDIFMRALEVPLWVHGDLNCDGEVDPFDLALLLGNWGPCPRPCTPGDPEGTCPADFDGNCDVDAADLAFLLGNWGP